MMTFEAGVDFGDYTIEGLIAGGGMGQVYAARDKLYGSPVALKVLHRRLHADEDWRLRFNLEGVIGQQLKHPHVVAARDLVEYADDVAIVLDLVSGGLTLQRVISREYPNGLDLVTALKLFLGIVQGVEYAHGKMVTHGDIKPENVLLDGNYRLPESWVPKVTDFGTVGIMAHPVLIEGKPAVVVSPRYASPEHIQGIDHLEPRSDVYSLGLLLHYLITGHHACPANTVDEAAQNVSKPVPLVGLVDQPETLVNVVRKATQRLPEDRYQSCRELAVDVRALLDELGATLVLEDLSADLATELMEERAAMRADQAGNGDTIDPGAPITDGIDLNTMTQEAPAAADEAPAHTDGIDLNTLAQEAPAADDVAPAHTDGIDLNTLAEAAPSEEAPAEAVEESTPSEEESAEPAPDEAAASEDAPAEVSEEAAASEEAPAEESEEAPASEEAATSEEGAASEEAPAEVSEEAPASEEAAASEEAPAVASAEAPAEAAPAATEDAPAATEDGPAESEAPAASADEVESASSGSGDAPVPATEFEPQNTAHIIEEFGRDDATEDFFTGEQAGIEDGTGAPQEPVSMKWLVYAGAAALLIVVVGVGAVLMLKS